VRYDIKYSLCSLHSSGILLEGTVQEKIIMITIYNIPERQYNNHIYSTDSIRMGDHLNISTFQYVVFRFEILAIDPGASLTVTYELRDGQGNRLSGSTHVFDTVRKHEVGFARGDLDNESIIIVSGIIDGRMTMGGNIYLFEVDDIIPPWVTIP